MIIQIIKDIVLILVFLVVILLSGTFIINIFFTKAPYVPSKGKIVDQILKELKMKPGQVIYDLGCGDGRFLFRAEKMYQTKGIGYELAPLPYILAKIWQWTGGYKSQIILGNFFKVNLKDAEIIFCYLFPELVTDVYHKAVKECRPGTIIVSNTFTVKGIKPNQIFLDHEQKPKIYLYQI